MSGCVNSSQSFWWKALALTLQNDQSNMFYFLLWVYSLHFHLCILADAFIQSDLCCIQGICVFCSCFLVDAVPGNWSRDLSIASTEVYSLSHSVAWFEAKAHVSIIVYVDIWSNNFLSTLQELHIWGIWLAILCILYNLLKLKCGWKPSLYVKLSIYSAGVLNGLWFRKMFLFHFKRAICVRWRGINHN